MDIFDTVEGFHVQHHLFKIQNEVFFQKLRFKANRFPTTFSINHKKFILGYLKPKFLQNWSTN